MGFIIHSKRLIKICQTCFTLEHLQKCFKTFSSITVWIVVARTACPAKCYTFNNVQRISENVWTLLRAKSNLKHLRNIFEQKLASALIMLCYKNSRRSFYKRFKTIQLDRAKRKDKTSSVQCCRWGSSIFEDIFVLRVTTALCGVAGLLLELLLADDQTANGRRRRWRWQFKPWLLHALPCYIKATQKPIPTGANIV